MVGTLEWGAGRALEQGAGERGGLLEFSWEGRWQLLWADVALGAPELPRRHPGHPGDASGSIEEPGKTRKGPKGLVPWPCPTARTKSSIKLAPKNPPPTCPYPSLHPELRKKKSDHA